MSISFLKNGNNRFFFFPYCLLKPKTFEIERESGRANKMSRGGRMMRDPNDFSEDDPLAPARGLTIGLLLGGLCWVFIMLAIVYFWM